MSLVGPTKTETVLRHEQALEGTVPLKGAAGAAQVSLSTFAIADVSIEMPEELDISQLRGAGLQPGEEELPDIAPPLVTPDEPKGSLGFYGNEDEDSFCSPHFSSPTC